MWVGGSSKTSQPLRFLYSSLGFPHGKTTMKATRLAVPEAATEDESEETLLHFCNAGSLFWTFKKEPWFLLTLMVFNGFQINWLDLMSIPILSPWFPTISCSTKQIVMYRQQISLYVWSLVWVSQFPPKLTTSIQSPFWLFLISFK